MKIEQQVTSLEISKRLKELGVKQDGYFTWAELKRGDIVLWDSVTKDLNVLASGKQSENAIASAFSVAELGELFPIGLQIYSYKFILNGKEAWDCIGSHPKLCTPSGDSCGDGQADCMSETEADARGKMIVFLLENKML